MSLDNEYIKRVTLSIMQYVCICFSVGRFVAPVNGKKYRYVFHLSVSSFAKHIARITETENVYAHKTGYVLAE